MAGKDEGSEAANGTRDEAGLTPAQRTWLAHIRRCEDEGLTYKAYCQREGLKVGGLYAARKVLRGHDRSGGEPEAATSPPRFAAVRLSQAPAANTVEVMLASGTALRVSLSSVDEVVELVQRLGQMGP